MHSLAVLLWKTSGTTVYTQLGMLRNFPLHAAATRVGGGKLRRCTQQRPPVMLGLFRRVLAKITPVFQFLYTVSTRPIISMTM
jgi:hypothetical protein